MLKLDWTLKTPEERTQFVTEFLETFPKEQQTNAVLNELSDYIFKALSKEERQEHKILTDNRRITLNKRETSYEGLAERFENGDDGIYNISSNMGKEQLLTHKVEITEKDIAEVPYLKELVAAIAETEQKFKEASGKRKYYLKRQLMEMYSDQYVLKTNHYQPMSSKRTTKSYSSYNYDETIYIDEHGEPHSDGKITLFNPIHVAAILSNYEQLKNAAAANFRGTLWYFMEDFNTLIEKSLRPKYPILYDLFLLKISGMHNLEIQEKLFNKYNIHYSIVYISSLWCRKIPKILSEQAKENYLIWYYTYVEYGQWKRCNRCGKIKLAHNRFFSINASSKDGLYSICKECRNSIGKKEKGGSGDAI